MKYFNSLKPSRLGVTLLLAVGAVLGVTAIATASTVGPISFAGYTTGNIDGQQGWSNTGSYDANVVNAGRFGFGQALQISNAKASYSFSDQTFSPGVEPAGESALPHFDASFKIGTTTDNYQPDLRISVSPDSGRGDRMSYLRFEDQSDGVHVIFLDATFSNQDIATLSRKSAHTIRFQINFKSGPGNPTDDVKIFVDGKKVWTGTTWESYYRDDPEQKANGNVVPTVSKLLFRAGGESAPSNASHGFLIDDVQLASS